MEPEFEYIIPSNLAVAYTNALLKIYDKLGRPTDLTSNSSWVFVDNVVQMWKKHYPQELEDFIYDIKHDLAVELSVHDLTRDNKFGYNPITYPPALFALLRTFFSHQDLINKKNIIKFIKRYPFLKSTNLSL